MGRDPGPRQGPIDRGPRGHHPGLAPTQERRVRRLAEEQRHVPPQAVGDVDCPVGALDSDVDMGAEDQELTDDVAELVDELRVAGALDDQLVLPAGKRMGPGGADQEPAALRDLGQGAAQGAELVAGGANIRTGSRRDLEERLHQLRLHLALELLWDVSEDPLDLYRVWEPAGMRLRARITGSVAVRILPRSQTAEKDRPLAVGKQGVAAYRNRTTRGVYVYVEIRPSNARAAEYTLRLSAARR